jgi:transketolase
VQGVANGGSLAIDPSSNVYSAGNGVIWELDPLVVALDGEVSNSTYAVEFKKAYPERYFEMFIAEQQLVAAATGLAARGLSPIRLDFRSVFDPAYDFIRMGVTRSSPSSPWQIAIRLL